MNRGGDGLLPVRGVLRSRQRLAPAEVARLFAELPELIDRAGARLSPSPLLHQVYVGFAADADLAELIREDVASWPAFHLLFGSGEEELGDSQATMLSTRHVQHGAPAVRFAGLLYEMLGGRVRYEELIAGRYSPLAVVGEPGNQLLKLALQPRAFADCRSVWEAWRATFETSAPKSEKARAPSWKIPAALLDAAARADVLELAPVSGAAPPVRLVARAEFRIGRSRRLADLAILPREETHSARCIVEELSRVHAMAVRTSEGLALRDGDGTRGSSNGALWQGQPLSPQTPALLAAPGLLVLSPKGCRYEIEVTPLAVAPEDRGEIANLAGWAGAVPPGADESDAPFGAVAFATPPQFAIMRPALWLRTSVRVEAQASGELSWGRPEETAQLIVHRAGAFWIVRTGSRATVHVGEVGLALGEIAPLTDGATVQIAAAAFLITSPRG